MRRTDNIKDIDGLYQEAYRTTDKVADTKLLKDTVILGDDAKLLMYEPGAHGLRMDCILALTDAERKKSRSNDKNVVISECADAMEWVFLHTPAIIIDATLIKAATSYYDLGNAMPGRAIIGGKGDSDLMKITLGNWARATGLVGAILALRSAGQDEKATRLEELDVKHKGRI